MKFCEIGVYHHDCWFTDAISLFPELAVKETSSRVCNTDSGIKVNKASYKISSPGEAMLHDFLSRISQGGRVLEVKPLSITGNSAIIEVSWKAAKTSYDAVLGSGCSVTSSCYAKDGYETYSLFAENPGGIKKLLDELDQIGETKIFSIKNAVDSKSKFGLTPKQRYAIVSAISMGYYEWPKKANLEELAAKLGVKRRTLQENLRKAEGKLLPKLLDEL
ncbi:TPA: hypothetical protein HA238_02480 [Candidatus Micrarchaeota archaeon]|nr:hypothetical protein [Candidatus Micrarchaeota archaeon]